MDTSDPHAMPAAPAPPAATVQVQSWPSEQPLFVFVLLASLGLWAILTISIFGLAYVALIGLFLFFVHLAFVTHLRGSAVRLGPRQFPELHERVQSLARAAGLRAEPEAYLLEAGGSLNALATKFFRGRMIVLFSDLLEACDGDEAARDMVIGHEIGHLRAGHLDFRLLTAPGRLVPFLGAAYSRACERTCDRWGRALCGDASGAVRGLAILAAGGVHGRRLNLEAFVAQRRDLDNGWMTLGSWLSFYPPLSERVEALSPALATGLPENRRGPLRAAGLLALITVVPMVALAGLGFLWVQAMAKLGGLARGIAGSTLESSTATPLITDPVAINAARLQVEADLQAIAEVLREHYRVTGEIPEYESEVATIWARRRGTLALPVDPFTAAGYSWVKTEARSGLVYSAGPDGEGATDDDIDYTLDLGEEPES